MVRAALRQLVDDNGDVILARDYSPYGQQLAEDGTGSSGYGFTGEQKTLYNKYVYLRARWYSPSVGRFVSVDPWSGSIQQPSSLHKYLYVADNPANQVDPTGKYTCRDIECCTPPPPDPSILTPREYVEKYKTLEGSYDEIFAQVTRSDFTSFRIPPRALLAEVALAESILPENLEDMEYIMWVVRTRVRFNWWGYGFNYHAQIVSDGFNTFHWLTQGILPAENVKYAFDPKGCDNYRNCKGAYQAYRNAYRLAGIVMATPYKRMPKIMRRIDSFANYQKESAIGSYQMLAGRSYFGDDFQEYWPDENAFGDNAFWDDYEQSHEP